ncbi:MAG: helix-turn-helix domain-containing protein [Ruminococcaceae bacterium]|jgi:transcriptional regulator with XRE-family HTH domain/DNA-directed RNA polymerase subunit RPC12/RpoP|nr:helix-turn-helix domain-containing protein [Oscillospiraceae bacterium]
MNQQKTGRFISSLRKEKGLTQSALAEKLGITDRAVSKWETGKSLPDAAIMLELCKILGINVNELLSGERLEMTNYNEMAEKNLLEMKKQKEQTDRRLLRIEIVIGLLISVVFFALIFIASFAQIEDWLRITLIITGFIPFAIMLPFAIRIEQTAGYYECQKCGNRYIPKYSSVLFAMHVNRTRYMKCPKCNQRSWQKKVISKEAE